MQPLPKNKFFRLPGSYLWPVLRSSGPWFRSLVLVPALVPLVLVPGSFGPTLALPWPYPVPA